MKTCKAAMPTGAVQVRSCGGCRKGTQAGAGRSSNAKGEANVAVSALKWYKSTVSPLIPPSCRYVPTCSEYAMEAFGNYGWARGALMTSWRLARCNPLGGSGYDPAIWEYTPFARWWPIEEEEHEPDEHSEQQERE